MLHTGGCLFLTVLGAGKSKIKVPADSVSGVTLPGLQTAAFLLCLHMGETEGILTSFNKSTNPVIGAFPHDLV